MIIVFDTETTGLPLHASAPLASQPHIIELAAASLDPKSGQVVREFVQLINPGVSISAEITRITGLTDADVSDAPAWAQALPAIAAFFSDATAVVAHNLPFDRALVDFEMRRIEGAFLWPIKQHCTVGMFRDVWGRNPRLIELYEWSIGRPLEQTHRALDDVHALVEIIRKEEAWRLM
jgi:DNA polymerase III epsilon subunit-like protein